MEIEIPPRSRLFSLKPLGLQGSLIEGLSSYICRLAEAHQITTGTLISKEITPKLNKKYLNNTAKNGGSGLFKTSSSINGVGTLAEDLIKAVEDLTFQKDINQLTLINWRDVLSVRKLLRATKAWCPYCLNEMKQKNIPIYEPLIWSIQIIDYCLIHRIKLSVQCPNCDLPIAVLHRHSRNGNCPKCGEWVGFEKKEPFLINEWDIWKWHNIGELIKSNSSKVQRKFISDFLMHCVNHYSDGKIKKFSRAMDVPNTTFKSWITGTAIPSLSWLLSISYCTGISLLKILEGDFRNDLLNEFNFPAADKRISRSKPYKPFNHLVVKKEIQEYLKLNSKPISVSKLAEDLGYNRRLFYKYFSTVCYEIADEYLTFIDKRSKKRIQDTSKHVKSEIELLIEKNIYPSRRKVESVTYEGALKEEAIKKVWKEEVNKRAN